MTSTLKLAMTASFYVRSNLPSTTSLPFHAIYPLQIKPSLNKAQNTLTVWRYLNNVSSWFRIV